MQVKDTCPKIVSFKETTLSSDPLFPLATIVVWRVGDVGCKMTMLEPHYRKSWLRFPLHGVREQTV
jgi:hypothetical protein